MVVTALRQASSSPRTVALEALLRVEAGAWSNLVVPGLLHHSRLTLSQRASVTELVYGSLRLQGAADAAVAPWSRRPLRELEPLVRAALRLGAFDLLDGTAPHAAVDGAVEAVRRLGHRGQAAYVNAVLRKLAVTPPQWPDPAVDPVGWATTAGSHPEWIVRAAQAQLGTEGMLAFVRANNIIPKVSLRAVAGRASQAGLLAELERAGMVATRGRLSPDCVLLQRGDPRTLACVREGRAVVQDEASAMIAPLLAVPQGLVVDVAAGPGGKAAHAASLGSRVIAVDLHPPRAGLVASTARRIGVAGRVLAVAGDGRRLPLALGTADAVLVDAPCTNLGSLRRRPEARWRHQFEEIERLAPLQGDLLEAAAAIVRPGGSVIYCVCTFTHRETEATVKEVLDRGVPLVPASLPEPLGPGSSRQLWPHVDGGDGLFVAGFVRR